MQVYWYAHALSKSAETETHVVTIILFVSWSAVGKTFATLFYPEKYVKRV
jgi:hypothetical protein